MFGADEPTKISNAFIRRLKERTRSGPTVDLAVCPPIRPRPPVSEETLAEAERRMGFALPPLVRAMYTQVADGGYGPHTGVDRRYRTQRRIGGRHSCDDGGMISHCGNAGVRIEQILQAANVQREGASGICPCGGRTNAGSSIRMDAKKSVGK